MDNTALYAMELTKAHQLADKDFDEKRIVAIAADMSHNLQYVPASQIPTLFASARAHYAQIPALNHLTDAWKRYLAPSLNAKATEAPALANPARSHDCPYCLIVAARLNRWNIARGMQPGFPEAMLDAYEQKHIELRPTQGETDCWTGTIRRALDSRLLANLWGERNPYGLSASQILGTHL